MTEAVSDSDGVPNVEFPADNSANADAGDQKRTTLAWFPWLMMPCLEALLIVIAIFIIPEKSLD